MQDFDKKLTETDSYLQILIDQVKVWYNKLKINLLKNFNQIIILFDKALEVRIEKTTDESDKMRLGSVRDRANVSILICYLSII